MTSLKYINLGCGAHFHKDWVNVDFSVTGKNVIAHNLNCGIPFPNDTFDVVYHSHVLEHFSKKNADFFIKECYRVLKTNGILRVVIPDLEQIVLEYQKQLDLALKGEEKSKLNYSWIMLELFDQMVRNNSGGQMAEYIFQEKIENEEYVLQRIGNEAKELRKDYYISKEKQSLNIKQVVNLKQRINNIFKNLLRLGFSKNYEKIVTYLNIGKFRQSGEIHQWMYDRYSLPLLLRNNGFNKIEVKTAYESQIPEFSTFDLDVLNGGIRKPDSLFIEAFK